MHLPHLRHLLDVYQTDQEVKEDSNYWNQQNLELNEQSYSPKIPRRTKKEMNGLVSKLESTKKKKIEAMNENI